VIGPRRGVSSPGWLVPPWDRQLLLTLPVRLLSWLLTLSSWMPTTMAPTRLRTATLPNAKAVKVAAFRVWRRYLSSSGSAALSAAGT
jgi:hypothetical protein